MTIQVDPNEGFGPHLSDAFLALYGEDSIFVTATVDFLTWRYVDVLVKSKKLPEDFEPIQYGSPQMREALAHLLRALAARGLEKPSIELMQSAVGHEKPLVFQARASDTLGNALVARWMHLLEQEDYAGATALLAVQ